MVFQLVKHSQQIGCNDTLGWESPPAHLVLLPHGQPLIEGRVISREHWVWLHDDDNVTIVQSYVHEVTFAFLDVLANVPEFVGRDRELVQYVEEITNCCALQQIFGTRHSPPTQHLAIYLCKAMTCRQQTGHVFLYDIHRSMHSK